MWTGAEHPPELPCQFVAIQPGDRLQRLGPYRFIAMAFEKVPSHPYCELRRWSDRFANTSVPGKTRRQAHHGVVEPKIAGFIVKVVENLDQHVP